MGSQRISGSFIVCVGGGATKKRRERPWPVGLCTRHIPACALWTSIEAIHHHMAFNLAIASVAPACLPALYNASCEAVEAACTTAVRTCTAAAPRPAAIAARDALQALYASTGGTGWLRNEGWNFSSVPCGGSQPWFGVTCDGADVVSLCAPRLDLHIVQQQKTDAPCSGALADRSSHGRPLTTMSCSSPSCQTIQLCPSFRAPATIWWAQSPPSCSSCQLSRATCERRAPRSHGWHTRCPSALQMPAPKHYDYPHPSCVWASAQRTTFQQQAVGHHTDRSGAA